MKRRLRRFLKLFAYGLALMGGAVGGFPPPRPFAREELPEEVIERVLDEIAIEDLDGVESKWGLRIDKSGPPQSRQAPTPEARRRT